MRRSATHSGTERVRAERAGRRAETIAALILSLKGYRILARRFQTNGGEIDLIAWKSNTLVCVEVKARDALEAALFAVTPKSKRRIETAARAFLSRHPRYTAHGLRFDILALSGPRWRHVRDAWREGELG